MRLELRKVDLVHDLTVVEARYRLDPAARVLRSTDEQAVVVR